MLRWRWWSKVTVLWWSWGLMEMLVALEGGNTTFPSCANDDIGDRRQPTVAGGSVDEIL